MNKHTMTSIQAIKIATSNKTFIVYNTNKSNSITSFILTDKLHEYYKPNLNHFKLLNMFNKYAIITSI